MPPSNNPKKSLEKQLKDGNKIIIPALIEMIEAAARLGKGEIEVPKEITEIEALIYSRGKLNAQFFRGNQHSYIVPSWVEKMLTNKGEGAISLGHSSSLINNNYRDWVAFGALNGHSEGTVTNCGMIVPKIDGYGLLTGLLVNNKVYYIAKDGKNEQQLLDGYLPIIENNWSINKIDIKQTVYADKINDNEYGITIIEKKEKQKSNIVVSIRPFNQEGVSLIQTITYRKKDQTILINGELELRSLNKPEKISVANFHQNKDSAKKLIELASNIDDELITINCEIGLANMTFIFPEKDQKVEVLFRLKGNKFPQEITKLEEVSQKWKEKITEALVLKTGNNEVDRLYLASIANLLLLVDPGTITPGPTEYHRFWCRDAAYLINALDHIGYHDYTEEALTQFISRQKDDGFFYSHEGEFDSNGEGIWVFSEHAKFTKNINWLKKNFDSIRKAAEWIIRTRLQPKKDDIFGQSELVAGLLPPGFSAEHLGPCDYFYWDNFWGVTGLREAAYCAKILNHEAYNELEMEYEKYLTDLLSSINRVYQKYQFLPVGPFRELDSAMIANMCAWYPTKILDNKDEILRKTAEKIYSTFVTNGGFFHEVAWNCYGTYLGMHLAQVFSELNDQEKVSELIYWLVKHKTCTMGWAEGISPQTLHGGMGDSPHGWASADWIMLLRNLFVSETKGNSLKLLSGFPLKFLIEGVSTGKIKTYYGEIKFSAKITDNTLKLEIDNNLSLDTFYIMTPAIITSIRTDKG
ncbi:MAG: hypothetical protein FK734_08675, partial [Asgard group archaeon]|nr:hypothetical protein [Asgard group archaeon]